MALAKKCDRCGKLHDHYPVGNNSQYNALRLIQKNRTGSIINGNTDYDLCPECMEELARFITAKISLSKKGE